MRVRVFMRTFVTRAMRVFVFAGVFVRVRMRNPGSVRRRMRGFVVMRMHVIMARCRVAISFVVSVRICG